MPSKPTLEEKRERLRALRDEAKLLQSLPENPAWRRVEAEAARLEAAILDTLVKPGELPLRQFDYLRGKAAGMRDLLSIPTRAEATLAEAERMAALIDPEKE